MKGRDTVKRLLALLLLLTTLPALGLCEAAGPLYEAYTSKEAALWKAPGSGRAGKLKEYALVQVTEFGEKWCRVSSGAKEGYVETKNLVRFRSLRPMEYPVPGRTVNAGVVILAREAHVKGGDFGGLTAGEGTILCVTAAGNKEYSLAVWRGKTAIQEDGGAFAAFVPWQDALPGDLIGGFTTYYNRKTGGDHAREREENVALACQRITDVKVQKGQSFSFNAFCGPYTLENGYGLAPNVSAKGLGYGGGVCQVSTTLYNALLGLPLQVDSFTVHSKAGVPYIPRWFDAAVGSQTDLTFTNNLPYAIRLWAAPQGGALTVLIYRAGNYWPEITED